MNRSDLEHLLEGVALKEVRDQVLAVFDELTGETKRLEEWRELLLSQLRVAKPKLEVLERIKTLIKDDMPIHLKVGRILHEVELLDSQRLLGALEADKR